MTESSIPPVAAPTLKKRALSLFFRVGCERQLLLYLYGDSARALQNMPPRQGGRAGLGLVGRHGFEYQSQKVSELRAAFGESLVVVGSATSVAGRSGPVQLLSALRLPQLQPYTVIVEGSYEGGTQRAMTALGLDGVQDRNGHGVGIGDLQPDLIQVLPPLGSHLSDDPQIPQPLREEIHPDGSTRLISASTDMRLRLRVIDVKLASEPGAHYFAETVFYSMTLAAWLEEQGLNRRFAVVAAPAVLPGSLDASVLVTSMTAAANRGERLSTVQAAAAFESDLELAPVEAFAPRILQLAREVIPRVLATKWSQTHFHVDYRCAGCEFLGDPHIMSAGAFTQDPLHCWPQAEAAEHLSRVFGLSRGASSALRDDRVQKTSDLAVGGRATAFSQHHGLKAKKTIFPARAASLHGKAPGVISDSGGDALMPRWPDLHVNIFIDYDPATSFSVTFGCRAFWAEPLPYGTQLEKQTKRWGKRQGDTELFLIDRPTLEAERREFLRFLGHLRDIFKWVTNQDAADAATGRRDKKTTRSTYQIYLWDEAQRRHFIRLVSRHLGAILNDSSLRHLAWIFPPPELLGDPETSSRRTPYTLVFDVIQNTIAVPAPHHYTLLDVTRSLIPPALNPPSVHPLFRDTLSNLTPPERIHEYWARTAGWRDTEERLAETTTKKLASLGIVVTELERRLGSLLSRLSAPPLPTVLRRVSGLAPEPYLWLEFNKLNSAVVSLDVHRIRAMPIHEREARFKSARLRRRLSGPDAVSAWQSIRRTTRHLADIDELMIFELSLDSRDFNARPGDINYALSPGDRPGFLDEHPYTLTRNTPIQAGWGATSVDEANLTAVSIAGIDRAGGSIALLPDSRSKFAELTQHLPNLNFEKDVVLDPVHRDYLSSKIEMTLQGIGNPACAHVPPVVAKALGLPSNSPVGSDRIGPAAEVLWQGDQLYSRSTGRNVALARQLLGSWLERGGRVLMSDQWAAVEHALANQLTLVWGPPGTGKSHTLRAIVVGAILEARASQRPLRVLISANTYTAVDNILLKLHADLRELIGGEPGSDKWYTLARLAGKRESEHDFIRVYRDIDNLKVDQGDPSPSIRDLQAKLDNPGEHVYIVGAIGHQIHNLSIAGVKRQARRPKHTQRDWFDLVIVDEASQMDVAGSTLVLSKRAPNGTCVLAGDDLQLPPIQAAEAPEGLEHIVGSIYNYLRLARNVPYNALNVSFRSNATLIAFTREAGYDPALTAHSPDLRLSTDRIPLDRPAGWSPTLPWSRDYPLILDPEHPTVCLVYRDSQSAQSNVMEADHIASLATLLRMTMHQDLLNEVDVNGTVMQRTARTHFAEDAFWDRGIGIVVPHRAQMSLVASRLITAFPLDPPEKIRAAVDTVERFQGQERDVIIAGFGIGDPDVVEAEEEFLFSLRRFNVMASRARAKLIVFVSKTVVEHLSDDSGVLEESLLIKRYAEQFCQAVQQGAGTLWELRWR